MAHFIDREGNYYNSIIQQLFIDGIRNTGDLICTRYNKIVIYRNGQFRLVHPYIGIMNDKNTTFYKMSPFILSICKDNVPYGALTDGINVLTDGNATVLME